ncbi:MAG: hypothetical protein ACYC6F_07305 [Longimicrobiales bacterium]
MTPARRRILFAGWATLMATSACDGSGGQLEEQGRLRRLAGLGIERFDSAAAFRLAGMSTHRQIQLDVVDPRKLGGNSRRTPA